MVIGMASAFDLSSGAISLRFIYLSRRKSPASRFLTYVNLSKPIIRIAIPSINISISPPQSSHTVLSPHPSAKDYSPVFRNVRIDSMARRADNVFYQTS
jgi:hypothetical protein